MKHLINWLNLRRRSFFKDVKFDKYAKKHILDWWYSKNIPFNRFSDLFSKYEDIVFPIRVDGDSSSSVIISDANNDQYYFDFDFDFDCNEAAFSIGKFKFPYDKEIVFHIDSKNQIIPKKMLVRPLLDDETYDDSYTSIQFTYDKNKTTAFIKIGIFFMKVVYTPRNEEFDNKIFMYFMDIYYRSPSESFFTNICNILKDLYCSQMTSFSIESKIDEEIVSEVRVSKGDVVYYSFTIKSSYSKSCLYKIRVTKPVSQFISENFN